MPSPGAPSPTIRAFRSIATATAHHLAATRACIAVRRGRPGAGARPMPSGRRAPDRGDNCRAWRSAPGGSSRRCRAAAPAPATRRTGARSETDGRRRGSPSGPSRSAAQSRRTWLTVPLPSPGRYGDPVQRRQVQTPIAPGSRSPWCATPAPAAATTPNSAHCPHPGTLLDQQAPGPVQQQRREPHPRPLHRFADRLCIGRVVLVRLEIRPHDPADIGRNVVGIATSSQPITSRT